MEAFNAEQILQHLHHENENLNTQPQAIQNENALAAQQIQELQNQHAAALNANENLINQIQQITQNHANQLTELQNMILQLQQQIAAIPNVPNAPNAPATEPRLPEFRMPSVQLPSFYGNVKKLPSYEAQTIIENYLQSAEEKAELYGFLADDTFLTYNHQPTYVKWISQGLTGHAETTWRSLP
ncbi:hypothetical protein HK098_005808, partial [Nowakowskiella sp. JEL0407]